MENSTYSLPPRQDSSEEKLLLSVLRLASAWDARLSLRSYCTSPVLSRYKSLEQLRQIPIVRVAESLGLDVVKTGSGTFAMREGREITSLTLFDKKDGSVIFKMKMVLKPELVSFERSLPTEVEEPVVESSENTSLKKEEAELSDLEADLNTLTDLDENI